MSSLDMVFHQSRRSGERERGLSDVVARVGLDATGTVFSFLLRGLGADHHAVPTGFVRRLDYQLIEMFQHVVSIPAFPADVGVHVGEYRFLCQVVVDDLGDVGIDRLIIGDAGAGPLMPEFDRPTRQRS